MEQERLADQKERMYKELFSRKEERVFTDDVELIRQRISIEVPSTGTSNQECTRDNLRHLAQGDGNMNLLYYDEEYAKKTRWGGVIAPPSF